MLGAILAGLRAQGSAGQRDAKLDWNLVCGLVGSLAGKLVGLTVGLSVAMMAAHLVERKADGTAEKSASIKVEQLDWKMAEKMVVHLVETRASRMAGWLATC